MSVCRICWLVFVATVALFGSGIARGQGLQIEFMAADIPWTNPGFTNYGFMSLVTTGPGSTAVYYGFYPKSGPKAFIGGPDVANAAYHKTPSRFPSLTISIRKAINPNLKPAILQLVNDWSARNYDFTDRATIDFVASVVSAINWQLPQIDGNETPKNYINKLKFLNELKPSIPGTWSGSMSLGAQSVPISILFQMDNNQLSGQFMVTPDDQGPCDNLQVNLNLSVGFSVGDSQQKMNFSGSLTPDIHTMSGSFTSSVGNGSWSVAKTSADRGSERKFASPFRNQLN
jgi:hypothetical protein